MRRSTAIVAALAIITVAGAIAWMSSTDSATRVEAPARIAAESHVAIETSQAPTTSTAADPPPSSTEPTRAVTDPDDAPEVAVPVDERALTLTPLCEQIDAFVEPDPTRVILRGLATGPVDGTAAIFDRCQYVWNGLPDGSYSIEIDDPRFARWTKSGLAPDENVEALLVGSCSVALTVIDHDTGQPMHEYRLRGSYRHPDFASNDFTVREQSEPAAQDGVYAGLVPGNLTLIVDTDKHSAEELTLDELTPHATRSGMVVLRRDTQVRGTVVMPDGTTPVADAIVRLRAPTTDDVSEFAQFVRNQSLPNSRVTRADGRFTFAGVPPGTYELFSELNPLLATPPVRVTLGDGDIVDETLVLPVSGGIRGRLLWACGVLPSDLRVAARRPNASSRELGGIQDFLSVAGLRPAVATVADDGTFLLDPLPPGPVEVVLEFRGATIHYASGFGVGRPSESRFIGAATVRAGETVDAVFDLGAQHPGFLRVSVTVPGSTPEGIGVRAYLCDTDDDGEPTTDLKAASTFDATGEVLLGPLLPGRYELRFVPFDVKLVDPVLVGPAGVAVARHVFETHRGTLVVVDENDVPQPHAGIYFCSEEFVGPVYIAGADGRIDLQFPKFRGWILDARTREERRRFDTESQYDWPPANGELRVVVK